MTTKLQLGFILMELACQLGLRRACLHARWIPRLQKVETDALTNGDYRHLSAGKRIHVALEGLDFRVMSQLLAEGEEYERELEVLKAEQKACRQGRPGGTREGRVRKDQTLRVRDPWG